MLLKNSTYLILTIVCFFYSNNVFGFDSLGQIEIATNSSVEISQDSLDVVIEYRNLARRYADSLQADKAINYAEKYIRATSDLSIINDHFFSKIVYRFKSYKGFLHAFNESRILRKVIIF